MILKQNSFKSIFFIVNILLIVYIISFSGAEYQSINNENKLCLKEEEEKIIINMFKKMNLFQNSSLNQNTFNIFFQNLSKKFNKKFQFINKNPDVLKDILKQTIFSCNSSINNKLNPYLIDEEFPEFFINDINNDIKQKETTPQETILISLLQMIKINTYLFNSIIKYSNNVIFTNYFINLKNNDKINISEFLQFIPSYYKIFLPEVGFIIYFMIRNNCKSEFFKTFFIENYEISKDNKIIQRNNNIPIARAIGYPGILLQKDEYNYENKEEIYKISFNKIMLKSPPFFIIDVNEKVEINSLNKINGVNNAVWNISYLNSYPQQFIQESIYDELPVKYNLIGFIAGKIIDSDNPSLNYSYKYTSFYKKKGEWTKDFYKFFEINLIDNYINIKIKYKYLLNILSLHYERI